MTTLIRKLYRPGIQVIDPLNPEPAERRYRDPRIAEMARAARATRARMPYAQYSEQAILNSMFGNCVGAVRTTIAAAATAQTAIATGSFATGGVSGNMDTTPASTAQIWIGHPGAAIGTAGATVNQYTAPHAFLLTASAATSLTIASQSIGLAVTLGDPIFTMGTGAAPLPAWTLNTLFVGLTTQAVSGATQANVLSGEPTSTGSYARIILPNTAVTWNSATAASPSVQTNLSAWSFPASTAAWSTGATNLVQAFISDSPTLAGGNVLAFGALGTAQAVAAAGITLSFATTTFSISLT